MQKQGMQNELYAITLELTKYKGSRGSRDASAGATADWGSGQWGRVNPSGFTQECFEGSDPSKSKGQLQAAQRVDGWRKESSLNTGRRVYIVSVKRVKGHRGQIRQHTMPPQPCPPAHEFDMWQRALTLRLTGCVGQQGLPKTHPLRTSGARAAAGRRPALGKAVQGKVGQSLPCPSALPWDHNRQWGWAEERVTTASMLPCGSEVDT